MKTAYSVNCEVIENEFCPYVNGKYVLGRLTPNKMCSAAFAAVWPLANAMRHSEKTGFEDPNGCVTISCPDGWVQFKLSRIVTDNSFQVKDDREA